MNEKPLITVVVPIYNVEVYLEQCIRSVLAQTYENFELLLVDDGSKDKSGQIVDQMAETDSRIVPLHQKNQGVAAATFRFIRRIRGSLRREIQVWTTAKEGTPPFWTETTGTTRTSSKRWRLRLRPETVSWHPAALRRSAWSTRLR